MRHTFIIMLLILACGDDDSFVCPDGFEREGNGCVEASADSGPVDSSVDGGPDATSPCGDCTGDTPLCNETTSLCVQCLGPDCTGDTPLCNETTSLCVQCLGPDNCTSMGVNTMCSDTGSCVECLGDSDCDGAGASVCATDGIMAGSCVACTAGNDDDCAGIVDGEANALNVCDDSAGSGVCVQCNAGDETACGANVCDVAAKTCSGMPANGLNLCDQCISDRQCMGDLACVQETFDGETTGFRCTWPFDAPSPGPNGACSTVSPFIDANMNVSNVAGEMIDVCQLGTTTCASLQDYRTRDCMTINAEGDAMCGLPGIEDGYCRVFDGASNRCTHACSGPDDCLSGTCPIATPRVCVFPE